MKKFKNSPPSYQDDFREKEKVRNENAGKFFYDLAKITFTVLAIGRISNLFSEAGSRTDWQISAFGLILTGMLSLYGNKILKK